VVYNSKIQNIIQQQELIMMAEEEEKCKFCGKSRFTQSTEQKDNMWASNKICESCGRVVKTHTFKERVKNTERK